MWVCIEDFLNRGEEELERVIGIVLADFGDGRFDRWVVFWIDYLVEAEFGGEIDFIDSGFGNWRRVRYDIIEIDVIDYRV